MVAMVKVLPSRERAAQIRELLDQRWPERAIVDEVFGCLTPEHTKAVRGVLADPHAYHPDVDEVAVARALQGDRDVWEGLTHYERREVMLTIHARRTLEEAENRDELQLKRVAGPSTNYKAPHDKTPDWVYLLAGQLGISKPWLLDAARDYAAAGEL